MPKTIATTPSWYWPDLIPRAIGIPPFRLVDFLVKRFATRNPDDLAFVDSQEKVTFGEAFGLIRSVTANLNSKRTGESSLNIGICLNGGVKSAILLLGALNSKNNLYLIDGDNLEDYNFGSAALNYVIVNGDFEHLSVIPSEGYLTVNELVVGTSSNGDDTALVNSSEFTKNKVNINGKFGLTGHSERSLLAGALSFATFLEGALVVGHKSENSWLNLYSLSGWQGLNGLLSSLVNGSTTYFCRDISQSAELIGEVAPNWIICDFNIGSEVSSKLGRKKKNSSYGTQAALLGIDGEFSPDVRRDISNSLGSALTFYGTGEIMVMVASHPSWYIDEAVGIAIPNMHIVPADPDTYEPIDTLWELLDQAVISSWSPSLGVPATENEAAHYKDGRFITETMAASDPNGMLYLLDSQGY